MSYLGCVFMYKNKRWKVTAKSTVPERWVAVSGGVVQYFDEKIIKKCLTNR